jgi:O-antigen/teichoic acid export membrane protein
VIPSLLFTKERAGKSAAILLAFTFAENALLLARGVIFARWLGPEGYGVFTLAFFFIPLTVAFAKLGVPSSFTRYIPSYEPKGELRDFLKRTYGLVLGGGLVVLGVCLLGFKPISHALYGTKGYGGIVLICAFSILPDVFKETLSATFSGLRVFFLDASLRFGQSLLLTVLGIITIYFCAEVGALLLVNLLSTILVTGLFGWLLLRYLKRQPVQMGSIQERGFYGKIFKFSSAYFLSPVVGLLFTYSDRWILSRYVDLSSVGVYSVASRVSGLIYTFGLVASTVIVPNLSRHWENGDKPRVNALLNVAVKSNVFMLLTGALLILLLKDFLVPLFFGKAYIACLPVIGLLLLFWLWQCIGATVGGYANLAEKTHILLVCNTLGLGANLVLSLLFIPRLGMTGAALASVSSAGIILGTQFFWLRREGLDLKPATLALCLAPLLLILPLWLAAAAYLGLLILTLGTNWLLGNEERRMLGLQFQETINRITGLRARSLGFLHPRAGSASGGKDVAL